MKQKRMIAVCDILGFSNLVDSVELDEVVMNAVGWFLKALHHSLHKQEFPQSPPTLKELDTHAHVGFQGSDLILDFSRAGTIHPALPPFPFPVLFSLSSDL